MTETERPLNKNPLDHADEKSSYNKVLPSEVQMKGPKTDRKCTDVYCLGIFVFFNVCMWTLSGWSYSEGDPQRLVHGWDIHSNFCGTGELRDMGYTYFLTPMDSIDVTLCVPGCPVVAAESSVCLYDKNLFEEEQYGCYAAYPSRPFYNNYCLPADRTMRAKVLSWLYSQDQVMTRVVGDLAKAWDELAIGGLIAFGAMMVYFIAFKLRYLTIPFYFLSVIVLMFLFAVLVYLLHEENWRVNGQICQPFGPVRMDQCDEGDTAHGYRDLAWTTASIGFACAVAIVCMTPRIFRGDKMMRSASRTFGWNPLPWVCPLIGLVLGVAFYAYFITFIIFTVSTGDTYTETAETVPTGEVTSWEFNTAERVLIFFDVAMILWWFSFIVHAVEFVTAGTTAWWFFESGSKDMVANVRRSAHALFRYHSGSVLLASVIIPLGRFLRNILGSIKYCIRTVCCNCLGCAMIVFKPCLFCYEIWFKYMTSDGMAFQTIYGGQFIQSSKLAYHLIKRECNNGGHSQDLLNSGNMVIWLFQLTITMSGVVFTAWWLQYDDETFKSLRSFGVSSVTAMALYELFITWFMAQLYAAYVRGVMHGSIVAYLIDMEGNKGGVAQASPFAMTMKGLLSNNSHYDLDTEMSKAKGKMESGKVAPEPAPVDKLMGQERPSSGGKPADLLAQKEAPIPAPPIPAPVVIDHQPENPLTTQGAGEEAELLPGKEDQARESHD